MRNHCSGDFWNNNTGPLISTLSNSHLYFYFGLQLQSSDWDLSVCAPCFLSLDDEAFFSPKQCLSVSCTVSTDRARRQQRPGAVRRIIFLCAPISPTGFSSSESFKQWFDWEKPNKTKKTLPVIFRAWVEGSGSLPSFCSVGFKVFSLPYFCPKFQHRNLQRRVTTRSCASIGRCQPGQQHPHGQLQPSLDSAQ